ncbi:hypothetical protein Tco_0333069 [Tanacetum coccineum]
MELLQGATPIYEGSCRLTFLERQEVWNNCRSYKVRVGSNGNLLWEASVLYDGKKVETLKFAAMPFGLTNAPAVFHGVNERVCLTYIEQASQVYILTILLKSVLKSKEESSARYNKDLEACLKKKGEGDCLTVETTEDKTSKAKNASTWDVAWLGPTSVKRYREWFILVRQGSDLHLERCKDIGYRIGVYDKIFYPSWSGYDGVVLVLMPREVKSRDEIFLRWGYCDKHDLSRLDNQSIERDRLIGIGLVLNFVKFISFTFGDKEMIIEILTFCVKCEKKEGTEKGGKERRKEIEKVKGRRRKKRKGEKEKEK